MKTIFKKTIVSLFGLSFIFILFTNVYAWNPANGFAICTVGSIFPRVVSDSTGGIIVAFTTGNPDNISAQRINSNGSILWPLNGMDICTAGGQQGGQQIISDGAGGAIIAWADGRNSSLDIYAQRINSNGSTLWTLNGVSICTSTTSSMIHTALQLVSDGAIG